MEPFSQSIPGYACRHHEKAGSTGWAQVNGLRGNTPIEEHTRYDLYYVENCSPLRDSKSIAKTIRHVGVVMADQRSRARGETTDCRSIPAPSSIL